VGTIPREKGGIVAEAISHTLVRALRGVPDFAALDDRALLHIVGASLTLFWPAGTVVFDKGEPSEALYVVLSGEVMVSTPDTGEEISRIGPGGSFGELSLLLHKAHARRAEAVEDAEVMVLPERSFRELLEATPELDALFRKKVKLSAPAGAETLG
jgi:CRP-like cAMP-binding protein